MFQHVAKMDEIQSLPHQSFDAGVCSIKIDQNIGLTVQYAGLRDLKSKMSGWCGVMKVREWHEGRKKGVEEGPSPERLRQQRREDCIGPAIAKTVVSSFGSD